MSQADGAQSAELTSLEETDEHTGCSKKYISSKGATLLQLFLIVLDQGCIADELLLIWHWS